MSIKNIEFSQFGLKLIGFSKVLNGFRNDSFDCYGKTLFFEGEKHVRKMCRHLYEVPLKKLKGNFQTKP